MREDELAALRRVVVERLLLDESPGELRAQLGTRLDREAARKLIAEAEVEADAARGEASFDRAALETRRRRRKGGYWRGPITTRDGAERIARTTAYVFGGVGALVLLVALTSGRGPDTSMLIASLVFVLPAAALWKAKSRIAAVVLLVISGISCLGTVAGVVSIAREVGFGAISLGFGVVLWTILALCAWRGLSAARFLRRPQVELATFD